MMPSRMVMTAANATTAPVDVLVAANSGGESGGSLKNISTMTRT